MLSYPPPHYFLFEPLNDIGTRDAWEEYKITHSETCEFEEIDAATMYSVDTFTPWFDGWITRKTSYRIRILLVWHADCLTFACQQMLRRQLEQRSFRCRVWFHVEDPTLIQPAIQSRCIVKRIPIRIHYPKYKRDGGPCIHRRCLQE
jgi:DNA polymerase III delta prime subunit